MAFVTLMPSEDSSITFICVVQLLGRQGRQLLGRDTLVGALRVQTVLSPRAGMELTVQAFVHIFGKWRQVR